MARIDLGRERGVQPTGAAQHGATSPVGYEYAMNGASRIAAAQDDVARGLRHVSDALFKVYDDQAESRNRQQYLEGITAQFDFAQEENEKLEARIEKGEFDGNGGIAKLKAAAALAQQSIDRKLGKWAEDNMSSAQMRGALLEHSKLDAKKNFAHLSGRFIAHDNKRRWDLCQSQINRAALNNDFKGGMAAIDAYTVGKSPELRQNLMEAFAHQFSAQRLEDAKNAIRAATTPEEIERIIGQHADFYAGVFESDRIQFDVFASIRSDALLSAEARRQAAEEKAFNAEAAKFIKEEEAADKKRTKAAMDKVDAEKANITQTMRDCIKAGDVVYKGLNVGGTRERIEKALDGTSLSADKKTKILGDFDTFVLSQKAHIRETTEKLMYQGAVDVLAEAIEKNNGDVDFMRLAGGDAKYAKDLSGACERMNQIAEVNEELANNIRNGTLTKGNYQAAIEYRREFFNAITEVLRYDKDSDKRGEKLATLIVKSSKFDADTRREFLNALYNKAVKNKDYFTSWSAADVKQFEKDFSDLCEWDDKFMWGNYGEDESPSEYKALRRRIMSIAKIRGLTPEQTKDALNQDPFYQQLMLKKSMKAANEYLR